MNKVKKNCKTYNECKQEKVPLSLSIIFFKQPNTKIDSLEKKKKTAHF